MIIVSLLALVCQESNVRYPLLIGQVKVRAKELDNILTPYYILTVFYILMPLHNLYCFLIS